MDSCVSAVAITDLDTRLTHVNLPFLRMWGYADLQEVRGRPAMEFTGSRRVGARILRGLRDGRNWMGELRAKRKDGSLFDVHASFSMIKDDAGGPVCLMGSFVDLSDLKRIERELKSSQNRLKAILASMVDLVFVFDPDGRFSPLFHAPAQEALYAHPHQFLGKKYTDVLPGHMHHHMSRAFEKNKRGVESEFEYWLEYESGLRWFSAKLSPIFMDDEYAGSVAVVRDMTERRRAEADLYQAQKLAAVGQLAAGVAHEINNPLSALSGEIQWMLEKGHSDKTMRSLRFMDKVTRRIALVVDNLLAFSRESSIDALETADLNGLIERALALMARRLELSGIKLSRRLAKGLPRMTLNRGQIEQVVMNVLINSLDAMPGGGRLSVATRLLKKSGDAEIVITDSGTGISREHLSKIFEPFFTTKPPGRGAGLGLAVSREIVAKHGGGLKVSNGKKDGVRVVIRLPLKPKRS